MQSLKLFVSLVAFVVVTSTEFVFNALVGGGGAWPGGEPHNNQLDAKREWIGTGLLLDASAGAIDANKITAIEIVGCGVGLQLAGRTSRNTIEASNIHLCREHIRIGSKHDAIPVDNRIEAFLDSQGIDRSFGAEFWGARNMLTLSVRPMSLFDVRFAKSARDNVVVAHSRLNVQDDSESKGANQILGLR